MLAPALGRQDQRGTGLGLLPGGAQGLVGKGAPPTMAALMLHMRHEAGLFLDGVVLENQKVGKRGAAWALTPASELSSLLTAALAAKGRNP